MLSWDRLFVWRKPEQEWFAASEFLFLIFESACEVKENRPPPVNTPVAYSLRSGRFSDAELSKRYLI